MKLSAPAIGLRAGFLLIAVCLPLACQRSTPSPVAEEDVAPTPWFEDVTDQVGLDFVHDAGPTGSYFMPQIMGSGAALFDCDGDGRLDIYLVQNGGPKSKSTNRLYHQRPDGRFEDVSAGSGLDVTGYGMGVAVGDVNNDGFPDVVLTEYRGCRLFLNDGKGHFTEATTELGRAPPLWGASAAFFDYDRDGWLDLVVTNYIDYDPSVTCTNPQGKKEYCTPHRFAGTATRLYHNLGRDRGGRWRGFRDVTEVSGLAGRPGPGLGVVCADFDGDGWPDIFVANDAQPNHLWINQHDGTFREEAATRGVALSAACQAQANMGIAFGDLDGDGVLDLYVTHLSSETNTLWKQGPERGSFRDRTAARGLLTTRWRGTGWGAVFADFANAGALDLALVNGRISADNPAAGPSGPFWSAYTQQNQVLANDGTGHFDDVSQREQAFCGTPGVYRGLVCGDVNNDGALDLLVTQIDGRARLYRNVAGKRGHWLTISAREPLLGGRDAYGATVNVQAGPLRWVRWINPGYSYLSSNDPRAHFGLGGLDQVDAIRVRWPDGAEEAFPGCRTDQWLHLNRGEGRALPPH